MANVDILLGKDCVLEIAPDDDGEPGAYAEIDLAKDVTMDRSKDEIDATNRNSAKSGYKAKVSGLKDFSIEFEAHKEAAGQVASTGMTTLRSAWASNATVWAKVTHGNNTTEAACKVGGGSMSQPLADAVTESFRLTNIGEVDDT
jgi:hypothetical protein